MYIQTRKCTLEVTSFLPRILAKKNHKCLNKEKLIRVKQKIILYLRLGGTFRTF